jgi:hypothetical protein
MMRISRSQFMSGLGLAAAASVGLVASGCRGDDDDDDDDGDGTGTGGATGSGGATGAGGEASGAGAASVSSCETESISSNHGHELVVPPANVQLGEEKSYDITGTADHPHTVTLSTSAFETLRQGGTVTIASTTDSFHSHDVTVTCGG